MWLNTKPIQDCRLTRRPWMFEDPYYDRMCSPALPPWFDWGSWAGRLTWASISLRSASLYRGRYLCRIRRAYCLKMAVMYTVLSTAETGFLKMPYTKITPSSEVVPADRKQTLCLYKRADSHVFFRLLVTHLKPLCYLLLLSLSILLWLFGLWAVLHRQVIRCSLSLSQGERFRGRSLQSIYYWPCFSVKRSLQLG